MSQICSGSIHTHFESDKDAVNARFNDDGKISFEGALNEFYKLGARKLAVTEHGAFNSFEDIYAVSKKFDGLDVIPGCEIYLDYKGEKNPDDVSHLILIAKDTEGYNELCKIISASNKNLLVGKSKDYPLVNFDILEKFVQKGHLIATSACIAGPLNKALTTDYIFLQEKIDKKKDVLTKAGYFELQDKINSFVNETRRIEEGIPTKEDIQKMKDNGDVEGRKKANEIIALAKEAKKSAEYINLKQEAKDAEKEIKAKKLTRPANEYNTLLDKMKRLKKKRADKDNIKDAVNTYSRLYNLFGDDFYFELQNHHLPSEKAAYNVLVRFAIETGHPQFIASNDIHICMSKDNPDFEAEKLKRKVARFNALHRYPEDTIDETEYGIKTDDELRNELLDIIEPYKDYSKEMIVDEAIANIKGALDKCKPFEVIKKDNYPKFADNDIELFENLIDEGLKQKFPNGYPKGKEAEYEARLKKEIDIIESMGYASYHLIVQDYLQYGRLLGYLKPDEIETAPLDIKELDEYIIQKGYKRRGYAIGPGRGSAAGSLACYLLGITDIDPIKYNLLFERFLNPERKSMPEQYWAFRVNSITQRCA